MNPLIRDILESLLRKGSTAIATYLVTVGLLTAGQATEVVAGLVLLGVSIAWSIYQRYKDRLAFLTALEAPPGTSEKVVKEMAKQPDAPSTLGVLLVIAIGASALGTTACGKRYAPGTTVTQAMAYELDEGLKPLVATQQKVIAAVDAACSPQATDKTECARLKPVADKFLTPVYELLKLVRDDVSPRLKQLEAAIQAVDAVRQGSLRAELIPLLAQLNTLSGQAFGVSLPDSLVSRATTLAGKSITTFVQLRDAVKELIDKIRADTVGTTAPAPPVEAY
jgi:hypothetical protein